MTEKFNGKLMLPLALGAMLNPINSSMIAVALVPIGLAFGAPASQTAWLVSALYVATAIGQPIVGKLVDTFGPRRLFMIGTTLVGLAGVLALWAPNFWWLVVARVILGFGTTSGYPAAMYLIKKESARTGEQNPQWVMSLLALSAQTAAVVGPVLGGFLIGAFDWRAIFSVNIPLSIIALISGMLILPRDKAVAKDLKLDYAGMSVFALTLIVALVFLLMPSWTTAPLVLVTVLLGWLFVRIENSQVAPFVNLRVLAGNGPLVRTYLRVLLLMTTGYSFMYGWAQWLQTGRHLSETLSGTMMMPQMLTGILIVAVFGRVKGVYWRMILAGVAQFVAMLGVLLSNGQSPLWFLLVIPALFGITQGVGGLGNQQAVFAQANPDEIGAASGLQRTFMYVGAMLGGAANGLFQNTNQPDFGMHEIAGISLSLSVVMLLLTWFDRGILKGIGR
ncbi:MAG TPA: MFS transporter [Lactobacillaceae bacterium]|jgi:MFS family permease